jgi:hypothetical protein
MVGSMANGGRRYGEWLQLETARAGGPGASAGVRRGATRGPRGSPITRGSPPSNGWSCAGRARSGANLSYPSAYRLSHPEGRFGRLNADTLDRLCTFFRVQPGALLEWSPDDRMVRISALLLGFALAAVLARPREAQAFTGPWLSPMARCGCGVSSGARRCPAAPPRYCSITGAGVG